jgi:hypothetical protein
VETATAVLAATQAALQANKRAAAAEARLDGVDALRRQLVRFLMFAFVNILLCLPLLSGTHLTFYSFFPLPYLTLFFVRYFTLPHLTRRHKRRRLPR